MRLQDEDSGAYTVSPENRIFSWKGIPRSSRIILITTMIIVVLITPNLAEGYYESSWEQLDKNSENNYNSAIIDKNGDAWVFGDNGEIIFGERMEQWANFESPTDVGTNNTIEFSVAVSDGSLEVTQYLSFLITNINDAPFFSIT